MLSIMAWNSIVTYWPANSFMANGVASGEMRVEQAVIVTDNATLPRAK